MFGASNYHWINYDQDKLLLAFETSQAARRGTDLHNLAKELIRLKIRLPEAPRTTMNMYVNDAIGFRMTPEQVLFYSHNFYGTADAIAFGRGVLRIHDLKTGVNRTSPNQLYVYAAFFCLEYKIKPHTIEIELRIYQNDEVMIFPGDPDFVAHIMSTIVTFDELIETWKQEQSM
jgi:hypothetical protein